MRVKTYGQCRRLHYLDTFNWLCGDISFFSFIPLRSVPVSASCHTFEICVRVILIMLLYSIHKTNDAIGLRMKLEKISKSLINTHD
jgi:hypothetical protein